MTSPPEATGTSGQEQAFTFACGEAELVGILHRPLHGPAAPARRGVLIVVGGPQYRVGSHRQFLLLARALAAAGFAVMRFDHRGIGDSDEPYLGFENIGDDIAAALDAFQARCPDLEGVALWGLCDAASAILFYAHQDPRVDGIVLLNPWVRTPESEARTYLKHYYRQRLTDRDLWRRLLTGRFDLGAALSSLFGLIAQVLGRGRKTGESAAPESSDSRPLPARMADGLARYRGPVLLLMSGQDLTAREFEDSARESEAWQRLLSDPRVRRQDLAAADHTFSRREWRDRVAEWTIDWLKS